MTSFLSCGAKRRLLSRSRRTSVYAKTFCQRVEPCNDGRIRRQRHTPRRRALGTGSPVIGSDSDVTTSAGLARAHGGPWPPHRRDTRDRTRDRRPIGHKKTAAPVRGRAVSCPWYHPTSQSLRLRSPLPARCSSARCGGSVTGAGSPCRAPAAAYWGILPVRSGALRSCSPAFLVPLRSDRGSLARSSRVLVLVNASVFDCANTVSAG